jgi:hypothetical protein
MDKSSNRSDQQIRDALITDIEKAFDGVQREDGVTLHEARVIDDYGTDEERAKARENDTEQRWQNIPDKWIEKFPDALPFLCPKSFKYYLPAFMIWALKYYDTSDSFTGDAVIYSLEIDDPEDYKLERFRSLSNWQASVVAKFLYYFAELADKDHVDDQIAQKAFNKYWCKHLLEYP